MIAIAQTNGHVTALTVTHKSPSEKLQQLREQLKAAYLDRSEAIDLIIVGLLSKMHVFLGGKPGTGKTELAKAVSDAITVTTFFHYLMQNYRCRRSIRSTRSRRTAKRQIRARHRSHVTRSAPCPHGRNWQGK